MWLSFKKLFRHFRLRQPRDRQANRADDQTHLRDAHQLSPTLHERRLAADAEDSNRLCQEFLDLAKGLQPSFPQGCGWLDPADLQDIEEPPVDGGRFADVWRGHLQDRKVAIKSYRCYVCFDCDRVRLVSCNRYRYDLKLTPHSEVLERSTCIQPPLTSEHRPVHRSIQHPKTPLLLGLRLHGTPQLV